VARRRNLHKLAERFGILAAYVDQFGVRRATSDTTRVALLAAMGVDASTEAAAQSALQRDTKAARTQLLAPVCVTQSPSAAVINLRVLGEEVSKVVEWTLELREEKGAIHRRSGALRRGYEVHGARLLLPRPLPYGYHRLRVSADSGATTVAGEQSLIVTPRRCPRPSELLGRHRVFGLLVNLYSVRSHHDWGAGSLRELHDLIAWCGEIGAAFVGVNPLHALANRGSRIGPYSPISRLYRNVLYLDIGAVPELAAAPAVRERVSSPAFQKRLAASRLRDHIDYERVVDLKLELLSGLHRAFVRAHRHADTARGRAYRRYQEREGDALIDFATFLALDAHWLRRQGTTDWHRWPRAYRHPRSPEVLHFRRAHFEEIDFHCYLQFELDRQLAQLAAAAKLQGLPIGIYQDLALGSADDSSDTWAFGDLFLRDARLGAPPDDYNAEGQNWNLPPMDPRRLARSGYDYFARVVRASLQHAGALRIDHIMGLLRQYWIPEGLPAAAGAYIRFPFEDLLGIVALESARAGALVIGEDLGTVPRELPALLAHCGVLSTRVLYFERTKRGGYRPARKYPRNALVSANTHDLAPLAGFWSGADLEIKRSLGILATDAHLHRARAERQRELRRLWRCVARSQSRSRQPATASQLAAAVHAFLASTPAALVGVALDDLAGESEPVNVPGVPLGRHRSWSRRMRASIESLTADAEVRRTLAGLRGRRWKRAGEGKMQKAKGKRQK